MEQPFAQPKPRDAPVDYTRPIKVICIGAGMSGILCGIRFPQKIPNLDLTIYDKNDEVGGVWYENRQAVSNLFPIIHPLVHMITDYI